MTAPSSRGLTPQELAFLSEMETITVIPRQRLESLQLISGPTPALRPPHRADIPLWLALLLKRQRRADIVPPAWLNKDTLDDILKDELREDTKGIFTPSASLPQNDDSLSGSTSPPFSSDCIATAPGEHLPFHWIEIGQTLLEDASDDIPEAEAIRRLLRDLREVRLSKLRSTFSSLDGGAGIQLDGIGAMEIGESRAFMTGVVDNLRIIGASREQADRERAEEEADQNLDDDEDEDML